MSANLPATITYCTRCGAEVSSGASYCGNCGQAVALAVPPPPTYAAPPPFPTTMTFPDSDGGLGKLFSASGRIGRLEYFLTVIVATIVGVTGWVFMSAFTGLTIGFLLGFFLWIAVSIVSICAGIKRLHDFDQSGWLILLTFVPFAGLILGLIMLFKGPSPGLNHFGYAGSGSPF